MAELHRCKVTWAYCDGDCDKCTTPAPTADEIKKDGKWELFDLISSVYYGKRMYFKQGDGIVYSRYSHKYMSVDEAVLEFVSLIDGSDDNLQQTVDAVGVVRRKETKGD